jgi:hypothetical protein
MAHSVEYSKWWEVEEDQEHLLIETSWVEGMIEIHETLRSWVRQGLPLQGHLGDPEEVVEEQSLKAPMEDRELDCAILSRAEIVRKEPRKQQVELKMLAKDEWIHQGLTAGPTAVECGPHRPVPLRQTAVALSSSQMYPDPEAPEPLGHSGQEPPTLHL